MGRLIAAFITLILAFSLSIPALASDTDPPAERDVVSTETDVAETDSPVAGGS